MGTRLEGRGKNELGISKQGVAVNSTLSVMLSQSIQAILQAGLLDCAAADSPAVQSPLVKAAWKDYWY